MPTERGTYLGPQAMFNLNAACRTIVCAFGQHVYLVGSVYHRPDWRDVDVRCVLPDEDYDALFGKLDGRDMPPKVGLLNAAMTAWLTLTTGLPVDFQFQRRTEANREFDGQRRSALGLMLEQWWRHTDAD